MLFELSNILVALLTGLALIFLPKIFAVVLTILSLGYQVFSTYSYLSRSAPKKEHEFLFLFLACLGAAFYFGKPYGILLTYFSLSALIRYCIGLYLTEEAKNAASTTNLLEIIQDQEKSIQEMSKSISQEDLDKKIEEARQIFSREGQACIEKITQKYEKQMQKLQRNQADKDTSNKNLKNIIEKKEQELANLKLEIERNSDRYASELQNKNRELLRKEAILQQEQNRTRQNAIKLEEQEQKITAYQKELSTLLLKQDELVAKQEQANKERSKNKVIQNYEIYKELRNILCSAKKEVDIMSPWASAKIVTEDFKEDIKRLVKNGVTVKIAYGTKQKDDRFHKTEKIVNSIKAYCQNNENIKIAHRGGHSKLIICDDDYYIVTSCNPLSHKGDQWNEIGEISHNKENLLTYRKEYFDF